jgi:uncharacterized phiE125 gp8 family phage protein
MLIVTDASPDLPITVEEARKHCEIDGDHHDTLLARLLKGAIAKVQRETGKILSVTGYEQRSAFCGREIVLEAAPVREVEMVAYLGLDGAEHEFEAGGWELIETSEGATILLKARAAIAARPDNLRVYFIAGYDRPDLTEGDLAFVFPEDARLAVLMLVAHWFRSREAEGEVPKGVVDLLDGLRIYR